MQQIKFKKSIWVDLQEPERATLESLQKRFRFHDLDLEDCLSERERPKVELHPKHIFIILKFPVFNNRSGLFIIEDLKIFLGKNFIITVHKGKLKAIDEIFQNAKNKVAFRRKLFGEGTGKFLWALLDILFKKIFPMFDKMGIDVQQMEKEIFEKRVVKNHLEKILCLKRNLITLKRILLPQRAVISTLEDVKVQFLPENIDIFFGDILDKIEKLIETSSILQDLVESLRETNETMLSHSLNNKIKILTVFSAVILPLTFVTGVFGMNVPMPSQDHPLAFAWILGGMGILAIFMLIFFRWRKWI